MYEMEKKNKVKKALKEKLPYNIFITLLTFFALTNISAQPITPTPTETKPSKETIEPTPPKELQPKPILSPDLPQKPTIKDISDITKGKSPKDIVKLFFALDLSGDRITGNNNQILKLTNWEKALLWDLYVVVDKWGLESEQIKGDRAFVNVQFQLGGRVVKNEFLLDDPQIEKLEILLQLNQKKNQWQIVSEQFPPHVARTSIPDNIKEITIERGDSSPKRSEGAGAHK